MNKNNKIKTKYHVSFSIDDFKEYYLRNNYNENMFNSDGSLNPNYNSFKKTGLIAHIFEDWWDYTYQTYHEQINRCRHNSSSEIKKIIDCHNKNLGFYVYAEKKEFKSLKDGIEYVTRYCGRAPISENRIVNYDGHNVTFCYNDHLNGQYYERTVPASDFIMII